MLAACRPPQLYHEELQLAGFPNEEFWEQLRRLNDTSEEVLENEELMSLVIPTLRADFQLSKSYHYCEEEPLTCPITVFVGEEDKRGFHRSTPMACVSRRLGRSRCACSRATTSSFRSCIRTCAGYSRLLKEIKKEVMFEHG
ncbi:MAG: thioesterase II family protein [Bacilli bacterium]